MIFSSIVLHAVTFSHVLHLDVLRRQIELKLKVKIEISLCMAIMQNHPLPSLYRVSHQSSDTINSRTLLCENEATNPITVYISVLTEVNN